MTLPLADYPNAIARAELVHLETLKQLRDLTKAVEARKAQFGEIVANDKDLSNDAKRKAAKAELELTDPDYLDLQQSLTTAKDAATEALIEVGRLANAFKLERDLLKLKIAVISCQGPEVGSAIAP